MSDISKILEALAQGRTDTAEQLLPLVYDDLRQLAAQRLAQEAPGQTLQPTALVHEAYLRVMGDDAERRWDGRGHFFAAAAEAMRRILVENVRRKRSLKRGGGWARQELDAVDLSIAEPHEDLLALDEALDRLAVLHPEKAELVKLRYFAGLTMPQVAEALEVSLTTAERCWTYARAWLHRELTRAVTDEK